MHFFMNVSKLEIEEEMFLGVGPGSGSTLDFYLSLYYEDPLLGPDVFEDFFRGEPSIFDSLPSLFRVVLDPVTVPLAIKNSTVL